MTTRSCAEGAQHGHHYRGFDLRCGEASALQLTADGEDECEQYQEMPLCGKVGAERARARSSGCMSVSTGIRCSIQ